MTNSQPNHRVDNDTETVLDPVTHHGQYAVGEVQILEGIIPSFDAYELFIRGHTAVTVGDRHDTGHLKTFSIRFDSFNAVQDIGVELMRATHIVLPMESVEVLEGVTELDFADTRWINNPLNHSMPFQSNPVTYPSNPATGAFDFDNKDGDDGVESLA
jgi:hypothetical protein